MSVLNTGLAKSSAADDYTIDYSCRFYLGWLSKTFAGAGNLDKWTVSCWMKNNGGITDGTIDLNLSNNFKYTPAGADNLEFSNETSGQAGFIWLDNSSGHTISPQSEVKKSATFATDVSTAGKYLISYFCDGTDVWVSASAALS